MLWRVFDSSGELLVPEDQKQRILDRYSDIRHKTIADGSNPIKKVPLIVDGFDAEVLMETVEGGDLTEEGERIASSVPRMGLRRQEIRLLASQVHHLRTENAQQRLQHEREMQVCFMLCAIMLSTAQSNVNVLSCCAIKFIG
jgi:hypothetical protein